MAFSSSFFAPYPGDFGQAFPVTAPQESHNSAPYFTSPLNEAPPCNSFLGQPLDIPVAASAPPGWPAFEADRRCIDPALSVSLSPNSCSDITPCGCHFPGFPTFSSISRPLVDSQVTSPQPSYSSMNMTPVSSTIGSQDEFFSRCGSLCITPLPTPRSLSSEPQRLRAINPAPSLHVPQPSPRRLRSDRQNRARTQTPCPPGRVKQHPNLYYGQQMPRFAGHAPKTRRASAVGTIRTPSPRARTEEPVNDIFVNSGIDDGPRLSKGVAPSGSSKTKARREHEARKKKEKLRQDVIAWVRAGGDINTLEKVI